MEQLLLIDKPEGLTSFGVVARLAAGSAGSRAGAPPGFAKLEASVDPGSFTVLLADAEAPKRYLREHI